MSLINDFEITVHAMGITGSGGFKPCTINVDSVFMVSDVSSEDDKQNLDDIANRDKQHARLDLKHLFSTSAQIATAGAGGGAHSSKEFQKAKSALFTLETAAEIEKLKQDGQKAHLKMLREARVNII
jgi:hypothetical protein